MSVQGLLYSYSEKNKQLILEQLPAASIVMNKSKWRELGRFPSKDSKGIEIVYPKVIDGNKTGQFVKSTVYDISQTYGRQIKKSEIAVTLKENLSELTSKITRITKSSPAPVEIVKDLETNGEYDKAQQKIFIREGLSQVDTYKEIVQESVYAEAHQKLGDGYNSL